MKVSSEARFFGTWAVLFAVGVLILLCGSGAWLALGWVIVAPTVLTALLLSWCYLAWKLIKACGGDPTEGGHGIWVVLSGLFVIGVLVRFLSRHHY